MSKSSHSQPQVLELNNVSITTLIPAMQIHLIQLSSHTPLFRRLGSHKFELCMIVLSELRNTYWGADTMYKLFEHALARVQKQNHPAGDTSNASTTEANAAPLPPTPDSVALSQGAYDVGASNLNTFYDPDGMIWDENNPFSIVSDEVRQQFSSAEWSQNNGSANCIDEINFVLSLEQFNSQFLDMGPT